MEQNKPAETFQPVKEDNLFKQTVYSGNFLVGSTKNVCSIYFPFGITGILVSMVNNQTDLQKGEETTTQEDKGELRY